MLQGNIDVSWRIRGTKGTSCSTGCTVRVLKFSQVQGHYISPAFGKRRGIHLLFVSTTLLAKVHDPYCSFSTIQSYL